MSPQPSLSDEQRVTAATEAVEQVLATLATRQRASRPRSADGR